MREDSGRDRKVPFDNLSPSASLRTECGERTVLSTRTTDVWAQT